MVALAWTMQAIYGMAPGEVFWTASDVGWVVGHSYIVYAPLLAGCTTVLYEGKPVGTPDAGAFWRVVKEHGVRVLFTAPTALRAIRKQDPEAALLIPYDLEGFRALFLAGERADPETLHWAEQVLGVPVIDHWWQTETGWPIAANPLGLGMLPVKAGSPTAAMPGYALGVLDAEGREVAAGVMGTLAIRLPLPPGCLPTLWQADERFRDSYLREFPGWYSSADAGFIDEDGYPFVMGRTDDVINVAGHRLSTGAMEEVVALHPAVAAMADGFKQARAALAAAHSALAALTVAEAEARGQAERCRAAVATSFPPGTVALPELTAWLERLAQTLAAGRVQACAIGLANWLTLHDQAAADTAALATAATAALARLEELRARLATLRAKHRARPLLQADAAAEAARTALLHDPVDLDAAAAAIAAYQAALAAP